MWQDLNCPLRNNREEGDLRLWHGVADKASSDSEGPRAHLCACMRQLDILSSICHVDGGPHENVQVVQFGIFLWKTRDVSGK